MAKKPETKRIPIQAGASSRDNLLMQGANSKARRKRDGSQDDSQGDEGAYAAQDPTDGDAAFPTASEAFPGGDEPNGP